ncbi:sigma-54-dependent Fis family transcriptional regulator [Jiella endophytica]|uniref:DNA-binding transcriptional regulator NtrC n=1 Tax=Jiella endophytica TaxID=2558362 RepID=A0A4Y8REN6_9HYPH|nr:sigma-54 dependent transcriptional regulator [Jiella endophytica]TFF19683.1 sigma-54-dependent Fis family transcriptional regulator [Jiella endophytica]
MTDIVLIVDDDPIQRRLLDAHVARMGLRPLHCDGGRAALDALGGRQGGQIAAVVLDLMMPDKSGMEVMAEMRRNRLDVPIVVQTAKGSIDTVVEAMRAGAFDFVVKPVAPERLRDTLANAVRMHAAARPKRGTSRLSLEGASPVMGPVLQIAAKAAPSNIPILIEGETGVGKEWLARAIRSAGERANKPFVAVNCGALPGDLVESILFGHARGAFTDATDEHRGKFAEADGGTLFLDEVGELAPPAQVKLLRVLQEGEIDPVGARAPIRIDVRVISATNRSLHEAVDAGRFREDLYYRLNAVEISMPPLRERRAEIRGLVKQFLARLTGLETRSPVTGIDAEALALLEAYDWPGNIRQLENTLHRAVVLSDSETLGIDDFAQIEALMAVDAGRHDHVGEAGQASNRGFERTPVTRILDTSMAAGRRDEPRHAARRERLLSAEFPLRDSEGEIRRMVDVEADLIRMAVQQYDGRMSEIARRLGIGRSTLYRKMREYKIEEGR